MSESYGAASKRTSGDGMEQVPPIKKENSNDTSTDFKLKLLDKNYIPNTKPFSTVRDVPKHVIQFETKHKKSTKKIPGEHSIYRPELEECLPLPPVIPKGKLIPFHAKFINRHEKSKLNPPKEPRFVPYEPYKCCVTPLVRKKDNFLTHANRNQLDINVLVEQMSSMKSMELGDDSKHAEKCEETKMQFDEEKESLRKEVEQMKKEKDSITAQLKFQVQVNSELKSLLVASVGEDLQTRVNVLTEDKLQLARALLDTANNLSTHTEQIEYLAGQSEVWRSKFLASSVMVEELARWKADLSHKNTLLTKSNKQMLQLLSQIRELAVDILKNLKFLARMRRLNIPTSNIIDITAECLNISQQLVLHSGIGMPDNINLDGLESLTEAERLAAQALENSCKHLMSTDEALKAIVGQAFNPNKSIYKYETSSNEGTVDNDIV